MVAAVLAVGLIAVGASGCLPSNTDRPIDPSPGSGSTGAGHGDTPTDMAGGSDARPGPERNPLPGGSNAVVEEVVDGDTIVVRSMGDRERVRLIGIDTPETVHPTKPVECFGPEASERTKQLLPGGTPVRLVRDVETRDRYGRLLAYVFRASDGLFVNLDLVLGGFAQSYRFPPNDTLSAQFARAEASARRHRAGMWSECTR